MSDKHSAKFKAQIALEAFSLKLGELEEFADSKGVTKDEVIDWVDTLKSNSSILFKDGFDAGELQDGSVENVSLETSDELLIASVNHGVNDDNLNYNRLFFWSILGTVLVAVIIYGVVNFAQASWFDAQNEASINSEYSQVKEQKAKDAEILNSFGVVNLEEGVYRIPIDEAISIVAEN